MVINHGGAKQLQFAAYGQFVLVCIIFTLYLSSVLSHMPWTSLCHSPPWIQKLGLVLDLYLMYSVLSTVSEKCQTLYQILKVQSIINFLLSFCVDVSLGDSYPASDIFFQNTGRDDLSKKAIFTEFLVRSGEIILDKCRGNFLTLERKLLDTDNQINK